MVARYLCTAFFGDENSTLSSRTLFHIIPNQTHPTSDPSSMAEHDAVAWQQDTSSGNPNSSTTGTARVAQEIQSGTK